MARSVRDLRELICVSRLTYHESDNDILSDSDSTLIEADLQSLSLENENCCDVGDSKKSKKNSDSLKSSLKSVSPDSGFITNSSPPSISGSRQNSFLDMVTTDETTSTSCDGPDLTPSPPTTAPKQKRRKKKKMKVPPRHELPKVSTLPPVNSNSQLSCSLHEGSNMPSESIHCFDSMLTYVDASIITGWLQRANDNVKELSRFCNYKDCFVQFAHFWFSSFPDVQKASIFQMEYDILTDEFNLAFAVGRQSGKISRKDVISLLDAIFKEYPSSLLGAKGGHLFLNYLDVLSSDRTGEYKQLLSDVKCSTKNKQFAQWLLASRSFALVNVWSAVLNFYRNLVGKHNVAGCLPLPSSLSLKNVHQQRMYHAVRGDHVDVINYLIKENHINPCETDNHNRTWVFTAVMFNCPNALSYLLKRVKPKIDVNIVSDTGNTALHAAANQGNTTITEILLKSPGIQVNCINPQCENSTPLHLAAMHGHLGVVKCLVKFKADMTMKMGELTPRDIAETFGKEEIARFFKSV